jgi:hypothetical protein
MNVFWTTLLCHDIQTLDEAITSMVMLERRKGLEMDQTHVIFHMTFHTKALTIN